MLQTKTPIYRYVTLTIMALALLVLSGCGQWETQDTSQHIVFLQKDPRHPGQQSVRILGKEFILLDKVARPSADTLHLLRHTRIGAGESVLDIGTGTGVQAVFAARRASHVVATDIDPLAARNARINIHRYGLDDKIEVRIGDLFAPIKADERFDVIVLNIPYPSETDPSPWSVHERFFAAVKTHLNPQGRIYYQTGYRRNLPTIITLLQKNGLRIVTQHFTPSVLEGAEHITLEIQARQ